VISVLKNLVDINRRRSDIAEQHMKAMRREYELRLAQEIKYAEALERTQEELTTRNSQVELLMQNLVNSNHLLAQIHRIRDLKEECQNAQQALKIAQSATVKASEEYSTAQVAYFRLISRTEVCTTEYKTLQIEKKRSIEQKSEQELDDNYCKQRGGTI
jgi:hypothetical protein